MDLVKIKLIQEGKLRLEYGKVRRKAAMLEVNIFLTPLNACYS